MGMCKCDVNDIVREIRSGKRLRKPKAWGEKEMKRPICPICRKLLNINQVSKLKSLL